MIRYTYPGALYSDAKPNGNRIVMYPGPEAGKPETQGRDGRFETYLGRIEFPAGEAYGLMFPRLSDVGFKFAGLAHDTKGIVHEYTDASWHQIAGITPPIYRDGILITTPVMDSAQGWRYVADNGALVSVQDTYGPVHGVSQYTERRGCYLGQGHDDGGIVFWDGAVLRQLDTGPCSPPIWNRDGEDNAISYYKAGEGAHLVFCRFEELLQLPEVGMAIPRVWFGPCIGSQDMVRIYDDPSVLAPVGCVAMVTENILNLGTDIGPNTFEALQANHAFAKLKQAGIALAIEGSPNLGDLETVDKIKSVGGQQTFCSLSEPLADLYLHPGPGKTLETTIEKVVDFTDAATAKGVRVGWLEGWPSVRVDQYRPYLEGLRAHGVTPAYLHVDVDRRHADQLHLSMGDALKSLRALAAEYAIPFGAMLWPYDAKDEAACAADIQKFAVSVKAAIPDQQQVCVQAWAVRTTNQRRELPNNLGANGLLSSLNQAIALFGGGPDPIPIPPDPTTGDVMFSTYTEKPIAIKALKPKGALSTAVLPSGEVVSCQPDGKLETRPSGADGAWEVCRANGQTLTFHPEGQYFTFPYVVVEGL